MRMTYTYPEQLQKGELADGRIVSERIPGHPIRMARGTDVNTWEQPMIEDFEACMNNQTEGPI